MHLVKSDIPDIYDNWKYHNYYKMVYVTYSKKKSGVFAYDPEFLYYTTYIVLIIK